ncbi:DUF3592 domain-containing protein [Archangium primigenium]|uniref:DUF3592 domain-containing protein n=1 Tax=[Archangium] primigenium TaxID=2792470 RepID=UPI00195EF1A0|nr:DUF3592 domain-containing protein [Archangium primigenium]MBM7116281.1 DUF3592 domain-containing protein [Archangium primigenium]
MRSPYPAVLLAVILMMAPLVVANGLIFRVLAHQYLSASHPRASGLITHSEVVSEGEETYTFEVRYTYVVKGLTYESDRYRYAAWSGGEDRARDFARRFPVGARVPVFHDPESPWEAVLVTGIDGMYLFLLMFVTPFNAAMFMGVRHLLLDKEGLSGMFKRPDSVYDLPEEDLSPLAMGIGTVGIASCVALVVMFMAMSLTSSLIPLVLIWGAVLATGVYFARKQHAELAKARMRQCRTRTRSRSP